MIEKATAPENEPGKRFLIESQGENIYLYIGQDGKHSAAIPYENRPANADGRRYMDAVMRKLSELNGYFEPEEDVAP
jgi:hypothetical protein